MTDWNRIEKLLAEWNQLDREVQSQIDILMLYEQQPSLEHRKNMVRAMSRLKGVMDDVVRELWDAETTGKAGRGP